MPRGTPVRLYGPALVASGAAADKYTVAAGKRAVIRHIHVNNTSGTPATITLSVGADAAATEIMTAKSVPANDYIDYWCELTLAAAEKIQGTSGTNNVLNLTIEGWEEVA